MFDGILLCGTSEVSLDDKGRLAIPAKFRKVIKDDSENTCILTRSLTDRCLWLYPLCEWNKVMKALQTLPSSDKLVRSILRTLVGGACYCNPDAQGRILITPEMRSAYLLSKKALLIGIGNKFELWSDTEYKAQLEHDNEFLRASAEKLCDHPGLGNLKL